jgi:hypothetical protein
MYTRTLIFESRSSVRLEPAVKKKLGVIGRGKNEAKKFY